MKGDGGKEEGAGVDEPRVVADEGNDGLGLGVKEIDAVLLEIGHVQVSIEPAVSGGGAQPVGDASIADLLNELRGMEGNEHRE